MLELQNDVLRFSFPQVHPSAVLNVTLVRTLRIPDDGKNYPLPPGLGTFPTRHVDDFASKVPKRWTKHGGVLIPMYQSEAMWLKFDAGFVSDRGVYYPFAIRVATGKRSAVTGGPWTKSLKERDYLVSPMQPWLDGYVVADGIVRQFVAAPLGHGLTAEEQITGKAEFSGLQIEVTPMKLDCFNNRYPVKSGVYSPLLRGVTLSSNLSVPATSKIAYSSISDISYNSMHELSATILSARGESNVKQIQSMCKSKSVDSSSRSLAPKQISELGLAPGGSMRQQVFEDPFGLHEWHSEHNSRCFVHLLNSMAWQAVTGSTPPTVPFTAADYSRRNMPWYDLYVDSPAVQGTKVTQDLKSVAQLQEEKGQVFLPENETAKPLKKVRIGSQIRDGVWKLCTE